MEKTAGIPAMFLIGSLLVAAVFSFSPDKASATSSATVRSRIQITVCGNGVKETGEQCDVTDLGGATCVSRGFSGGTLGCTPACDYHTSACVPAAAVGGGGSSSGGGGGGSSYVAPPAVTGIVLRGRAFPLRPVYALKDGSPAASVTATAGGEFSVSLSGLSSGNYSFLIYGDDRDGLRSASFAVPVSIALGTTTQVGGIFLAPTLKADKSAIGPGDVLSLSGQTVPDADVDIVVSPSSGAPLAYRIRSGIDGSYSYRLSAASLKAGKYGIQAKARSSALESASSTEVFFEVGEKTIDSVPERTAVKGNLNGDGKVNLVDFSIAAFWYKRPLSGEFAALEKAYLNGDGKLDLTDFSIMAYYWSG